MDVLSEGGQDADNHFKTCLFIFYNMRNRVSRKGSALAALSLPEPLTGCIVPVDRGGRRRWILLEDQELAAYAEKAMQMSPVRGRNGSRKIDMGLYSVLRKRGLIGAVFADIEEPEKDEAVKQVVDGLKEFGDGG